MNEKVDAEATEMRTVIQDFVKDCSLDTKELPPSLNSKQRMLAHQIAEEFQVRHSRTPWFVVHIHSVKLTHLVYVRQ